MNFLLLGSTGQVGKEFCALARPSHVHVTAPLREALDLSNPELIREVIAARDWDAVINAAAYTDVDRAESDQQCAFTINAMAPTLIAAETAVLGIPLIHISTDYVFDGCKGEPYLEHDLTSPLNVYGLSKLEGEVGIRSKNSRHVILRTSWVYSAHRKNFVRTILRLARERDYLRIVDDQRGCPTAAADIAKASWDIALACAGSPQDAPFGVYHYAGAGEATWFEFASAILEIADLERKPEVRPIRTVDYPTPASRPSDTRLNCSAIKQKFSMQPPPWKISLMPVVKQILDQKGAG